MEPIERSEVWNKASDISEAMGVSEWASCIVILHNMIHQQEEDIKRLTAGVNHAMTAQTKAEKTVLNMQYMQMDCAADLARAGGYDHKSKNEVILAVVARLLAYGNNPLRSAYDDNVPF